MLYSNHSFPFLIPLQILPASTFFQLQDFFFFKKKKQTGK